jgi:hypothetical protein
MTDNPNYRRKRLPKQAHREGEAFPMSAEERILLEQSFCKHAYRPIGKDYTRNKWLVRCWLCSKEEFV